MKRRPITITGPIGDLARVFPGGVQGLAERLRVSRGTIGRWAREGLQPGPGQALIEELTAIYLPKDLA